MSTTLPQALHVVQPDVQERLHAYWDTSATPVMAEGLAVQFRESEAGMAWHTRAAFSLGFTDGLGYMRRSEQQQLRTDAVRVHPLHNEGLVIAGLDVFRATSTDMGGLVLQEVSREIMSVRGRTLHTGGLGLWWASRHTRVYKQIKQVNDTHALITEAAPPLELQRDVPITNIEQLEIVLKGMREALEAGARSHAAAARELRANGQ